MKYNKVKTVVTIGPASDSYEAIKGLMTSGADVFRLNLSHGNAAYFRKVISRIRKAERELSRRITVFFDLPGPKLRTGKVHGERMQIKEGSEYTLGKKGQIDVSNDIIRRINPRNKILLSDGKIELEPIKKDGNLLVVRALNNGLLYNEQSINFKGISYPGKYPTKRDVAGIALGKKLGIRTFALSFVSSGRDVARVRALAGKDAVLIAKIERVEAVKRFEEIVNEADVIMVARGDLGLNMDIAEVPEIQKKLITSANEHSKPVITATQMLESMTNNIMPTRAEADDVFTAISEGTDAVMLSEETAIGDYPLKAVKMLVHIISRYKYRQYEERKYRIRDEYEAIIDALADLSLKSKIEKVMAVTIDGKSVLRLSRYDLPIEIFALTSSDTTLDNLSFARGVVATKVPSMRGLNKTFATIAERNRIEKAIVVSALSRSYNSTESIRIMSF